MRKSVTDLGVISNIEGTVLTPEDREFIFAPELSGLIFFARNYQSPEQLRALTDDISSLRPDLLLTVDQEGGRVQRFRDGFTRFAPMMAFEGCYQHDRAAALSLARHGGWLLAYELARQGVDLTFAPVLDIERDCSRVIGDRAFGHDAEAVTELAGAWGQGLRDAGMKAVGKHFPGHGAVVADSHLELPVDPRAREALDYDIRPFASLIRDGMLAGIMPAHVVYPDVDSDNTAGFSPIWLQQILRQQLEFEGVIFSDDLSMAGAASGGDFYQRSLAAAHAGANALVVCNNRAAATEVLRAVRDLRARGAASLSLQDWKVARPEPQESKKQQALGLLREAGLVIE